MIKFSVKTRRFLRSLKPPQFAWRFAGLVSIKLLNAYYSTLNFRAFLHDPDADPAALHFQTPVIFVFWHEYIPVPVYLRPHSPLAMLVSQHQDAEILSHIAHFAGLETVRGSTSRGGTAALKGIISQGNGLCLAITPDGPRGPRRELAQGCIYLSSRLQIPIVPMGVGYDAPWRNKKAWDQFAIPRPFSRCRVVLGPRIQIPPDLSRDEIEIHRNWMQSQLCEITEQAEMWAERKIDIAGSVALTRLSASPRRAQPRQVNLTAQIPSDAKGLKIAG